MARNKLTFGFTYDSNNPTWHPEPAYQEAFIRAQQAYLNDRLRDGSFLTANDVMEGFGVHRSVSGMVYGWDQDDRIELKLRRDEDGTVTLEFTAFNIYEEMQRKPKDQIQLEDASETDVLRGMVGYFLELYMGETGGFMGSPKDLLDSARHEYKNGLETLKKLEED